MPATATNAVNTGAVAAVFPATGATLPTVINIAAISGVTAPVTGATPDATITASAQYTGSVAWSPVVASTFVGSTVYTATITLTAKSGFTLTGVAADFFTVAGATSHTNPINSGVVTAIFPATGATAIPVTGVSLNKSTTTLIAAATEQLIETVVPANASNTAVTWSTNSDSASVNSTGLVTAYAPGSATITVTTVDGSHTATCVVTVSNVPTHSITFNANGGTGTTAAQVVAEGSAANLNANAFTWAGNIFAGWATSPTGGVVYNDNQSMTMGSSDVTLYAVWTASSSLLIHYNFGNQNCNDTSGNNINGTSSNVSYVSDGSGGYAASFNGSSSYITLPNNTISNHTSFTIMISFKASPGNYGSLFGYQNAPVGSTIPTIDEFIPMIVIRSDGMLYGSLWNGSSSIEVISSSAVNDGNWHTVYFSVQPNSIRLLLDGAVVGTGTGTVNNLSMFYNQIGTSFPQRAYMPAADANSNISWYWFNGLIHDFYFYNTALQ